MKINISKTSDRFYAIICLIIVVVSFEIIYKVTNDFAYSLFASLMVGLMVPLVRLIYVQAFKKD